jgi:deazaflavin-dependent oxidoreductase (nitroreductase family)
VSSFNERIIQEFRENKGRVGGPFAGVDLVLLTTTGAHSGVKRTNPLACVHYEGQLHVIAAHRGAPRHPGWYFNLVADPEVEVETGVETFPARAQVLADGERQEVWDCHAVLHPEFEGYAAKAGREIPVVRLVRQEP